MSAASSPRTTAAPAINPGLFTALPVFNSLAYDQVLAELPVAAVRSLIERAAENLPARPQQPLLTGIHGDRRHGSLLHLAADLDDNSTDLLRDPIVMAGVFANWARDLDLHDLVSLERTENGILPPG